MLGGGVGAQALIAHATEMGSSFRLIKLIYSLDGTQVFARTDESARALYKTKAFDIFTGPIAPGNHTCRCVATYRGHGYGVFEYLSKFTFTAQAAKRRSSPAKARSRRSSAAATRRAARHADGEAPRGRLQGHAKCSPRSRASAEPRRRTPPPDHADAAPATTPDAPAPGSDHAPAALSHRRCS